ncbi:hypothetical protein C8Q75DRAFT_736445 [Abortiporus biennis]|nr:hypothetical protein C8Q75DRAFT_736445 [Abortiporus biennis]
MRFQSFFALAFLAASAAAQRVFISAPTNGTAVTPGQNITVTVTEPRTLTGATEVAVVISMAACSPICNFDASQRLGTTLYNGPYHPDPLAPNQPFENFTVQVPQSLQSGTQTVLSVTHLSLVGAGPFPFLEVQNVTLNVE